MIEPNYVKLIEYIRNGLVEQVHFGLIIRMNKNGVIERIGNDNDYKFYHRSCMKPMQASLIIDLGIDKKYELSEDEIALCCASHAGDKIHQRIVKNILDKAGFTQEDLLCPSHEPLSKKENDFLLLNSLSPKKIHNNCSGKHAAMLSICREKNFPVQNYKDLTHPLSDLVINHVCKLCEVKKDEIIISKDGCGLPVIATSLEQLGKGFLNLFTDNTQIIENTKNVIAKVGACGLCVIVNIEKQEAVIIKIADSNMEARFYTAFEVLKQLNWLENNSIIENREIKTLDDEVIGIIKPCFCLKLNIF